MNLFQLGDFTLNSGARSKWKLECDALTDEDWSALAQMVSQLVGPFSTVTGVPQGGLKLAEKLKPLAGISGPYLIVDDVLTTGGSMYKAQKEVPVEYEGEVFGAVIFARGQCPHWIKAVFQMPECFWVKPRTR